MKTRIDQIFPSIFLPFAAYFVTAFIADLVILGIDKVEIGDAMPHVFGTTLIILLLLTKRIWVHIAALIMWTAKLIISLLA